MVASYSRQKGLAWHWRFVRVTLERMADAAKKLATYEDVLAAPRDMIAELVNGELFLSPRPAIKHAVASSKLGGQLVPKFDDGDGGPGGWIILDEPELHLGEHVLVPDLAGWKRTRMANAPDAAYIELEPDWICEVLSPSTAALDRIRKLPVYAAARIPHAWIVDPYARTLEVLGLDASIEPYTWRITESFEGTATVRAQPFDATELHLGRLWGE